MLHMIFRMCGLHRASYRCRRMGDFADMKFSLYLRLDSYHEKYYSRNNHCYTARVRAPAMWLIFVANTLHGASTNIFNHENFVC